MVVLGISGSPRKDGNSEILLKHALAPFRERGWQVREFYLSSNKVQPCCGCESCVNSGNCRIDDDMKYLFEYYGVCDALVIASPVYYRNVTAQLKAVFDRTYAVKNKKPLTGKLGGAIAVGRGSGGGQSLVLSIIYNFFLSSGVICVPGELNGVSAVADEPGGILTQEKRLKQARFLGENMIRYAEK